MRPLRAFAGGAKHFLVSPDGELNLLPLAALVDERGRFWIENYSFSYLTGGRDLLRMRRPKAAGSGKAMIFADPAFGVGTSPVALRVARGLPETYFPPLAGTLQEALAIGRVLPDAEVLTGAKASKSALKAAAAPRILHIATHGFFLPGTPGSANPLLRSGLALAGANKAASATDDGILTALEASGLDLWGTKLVVLSACDTGVGDLKNGEGVYGLRRAFALAGAETLLMSLWPVSDYTTRGLMAECYQNLGSGMGRGASLRQTQLQMMRKKGREHPFYWPAFIQTGEWANLDGKR